MRPGALPVEFAFSRQRIGLILSALVLAVSWSRPGGAADLPVDVELVLDVDVSWSMDTEELRIQREGYVAAFRSDAVIEAIASGFHGKVVVTYVEFTGKRTQVTVVPWTIIDGASASYAFAAALNRDTPPTMRSTSISGAIDDARGRFENNGFAGRRIVDVSGDGANNNGRLVTLARDDAVDAGITVNGLPLMTDPTAIVPGTMIMRLDEYYADYVIGGHQAFMIPVRSWSAFPDAVRRKLVLELAGSGTAESRLAARRADR